MRCEHVKPSWAIAEQGPPYAIRFELVTLQWFRFAPLPFPLTPGTPFSLVPLCVARPPWRSFSCFGRSCKGGPYLHGEIERYLSASSQMLRYANQSVRWVQLKTWGQGMASREIRREGVKAVMLPCSGGAQRPAHSRRRRRLTRLSTTATTTAAATAAQRYGQAANSGCNRFCGANAAPRVTKASDENWVLGLSVRFQFASRYGHGSHVSYVAKKWVSGMESVC